MLRAFDQVGEVVTGELPLERLGIAGIRHPEDRRAFITIGQRGGLRIGSRPAALSEPVRALVRALGDRIDRRVDRCAFVGLESVDDPEALVTGMAAAVAVAVEVEVTAVNDVPASGAGTVLGSSPWVVAKTTQRVNRCPLDGKERRVVLELGELAGKWLSVPGA